VAAPGTSLERQRSSRGQAPDDQPFLKWAGGKRWCARPFGALLSGAPGRYFEPFLGSGAVFFALRPERAHLSDVNPYLVDSFVAVRDAADEVIAGLRELDVSRATYDRVRSDLGSDVVQRGIRTIYLNRTAFNGLWRVNRSGVFNVPFGCKPETTSCNAERIRRCEADLAGAVVSAADFHTALQGVVAGDAVYLDPPYTVRHDANGFQRYNERIFSWADQIALAELATQLAEEGAWVVISNAHHNEVDALYSPALFSRCELRRKSRMAAKIPHRGPAAELLIAAKSVAATDAKLIRRLENFGLAVTKARASR
jgi:DNA adenine methylase